MRKINRIILKQPYSGLFYKAPRTWVPTRAEALDFHRLEDAAEFCSENGIKDVDVIIDFGDPSWDVKLWPS